MHPKGAVRMLTFRMMSKLVKISCVDKETLALVDLRLMCFHDRNLLPDVRVATLDGHGQNIHCDFLIQVWQPDT